jgi:hypothetical protein
VRAIRLVSLWVLPALSAKLSPLSITAYDVPAALGVALMWCRWLLYGPFATRRDHRQAPYMVPQLAGERDSNPCLAPALPLSYRPSERGTITFSARPCNALRGHAYWSVRYAYWPGIGLWSDSTTCGRTGFEPASRPCEQRDSNPHILADTSPSSWRVCRSAMLAWYCYCVQFWTLVVRWWSVRFAECQVR